MNFEGFAFGIVQEIIWVLELLFKKQWNKLELLFKNNQNWNHYLKNQWNKFIIYCYYLKNK